MARTAPARVTPAPVMADPRQMAADAAQEWFDATIGSADAHTAGHVAQVTLDDAFREVTDALEAEHLAEYGPFKDTEDKDIAQQIFAREAGYLIGVQVGLRLRAR